MVTLRVTSFTPSGGRLSIYIELFECVTVWAFRLSAHNCCTVQWNRMAWTGVFIYTSKRTNEPLLTRLWFWINDIHIGWCVINFWLRNRRNTGKHYNKYQSTLVLRTCRHRRSVPLKVGVPYLQIWLTFNSIYMTVLVVQSQRHFAHATTAVLSLLVQNFVFE